jgi:hypothetical protein
MATPTNLPASFVSGAILTAAQQNDLRGAFRVLQVVSASTTTVTNNATTTFVDTALSASITPQSATNKVLCITFNACAKSADNALNGVKLQVLRGATVINTYRFGLYTNTAVIQIGSLDMIVLDSPATTSATTYKVQIANENASNIAQYAPNNTQSTIVLMEISA